MCCGSMDCTHVRLGKCPVELSEMCKGKEGYPSLVFQCVVGPNRRIFYTSDYFFGSNNDKTVTANDDLPKKIHRGLLKNVRGIIYDSENVPRVCKGGYFLVDGGYNKYPYLIDPLQTTCRYDERVWSEWLESVRKDVECTFGMLKNRFRYFLNPIQHHKFDTIDAAWKCSCILHNMILSYNGKDILEWERSIDWENINPDVEHEEDNYDEEAATEVEDLDEDFIDEEFYSVSESRCGEGPTHMMLRGREFVACSHYDHDALQNALVTHFIHQYKLGLAQWSSRSDVGLRHRLRVPRLPPCLQSEYRVALYVKPSDLRVRDTNETIGDGLFSCLSYKKDEVIAEFHGRECWISQITELLETQPQRGYYCIRTREGRVFDTYDNYISRHCLASYANDAFNCLNLSTMQHASCNCRLDIMYHSSTLGDLSIRLVCDVPKLSCHSELLWNYDNNFLT